MNQDTKFMEAAAILSLEKMRKNIGGPFGAVIVKDGKIIAEGFNRVTSDNDPTAHAEVTAIRNACKALGSFNLSGAVMYSSCEPCPMCLASIYWARLDKVYFAQTQEDASAVGFDDSFLYKELSLPMDKRSLKMEHFPNDTAKQAMAEWLIKEDKISY